MQVTDDREEYPEDLEADLFDNSDGDVEDSIDKMAERFPNGEDPMMRHLFFVQCQKCDVDFEMEAGQQAWCPSCHAD